MAKLPKVGQVVECDLPGYEDSGIALTVWVNAPQKALDEWNDLRESAKILDEQGRPVYKTDAQGNVITDDNFEPVPDVDEAKMVEAAKFFVGVFALDFSLKEDQDGNPLSISDEDFWERLPDDLIGWVYEAISAALAERKNQGKKSVRLAGIIGR